MSGDTYWSDVADETFTGLGMAAGRGWKEMTMQDDSWNQQACEGFADVLTAGAGIGSYAAGAIPDVTPPSLTGWADEYRSFDNEWWPYG